MDRLLLAAAGCDSAYVQCWDPVTGESVGEPMETNGRVDSALAMLRGPDGRPLIAAAGEGDQSSVLLWDAQTGEQAGVLRHEDDRVASAVRLAAVTTPAADLLAWTRTDGQLTLWDSATLAPVRSPLRGHVQRDPYNTLVTVIAVPTQDGPAVVSGGCDGMIRYWSPDMDRSEHT